MPLEEPEPYTYIEKPFPERKSAMVYTPSGAPTRLHTVSDGTFLDTIPDTEAFQRDNLLNVPYDLATRGEKSTSFQPKVNAFLRPPTKAQWQYQSLTRFPSKSKHLAMTTNPGNTLGTNYVEMAERNPERVLVSQTYQGPRLQQWTKESGRDRPNSGIEYVDPVYNLREPQRESEPKNARPVAPITSQTGPIRFHVRTEPKSEENRVDPKRNIPITIEGQAPSESFIFKYKTQPSTMEPGQRTMYRTRPRSEYDDIQLSRKQDQKNLVVEEAIPYQTRIAGANVQEAKQARYVPMLTPKYETRSVIPVDIGVVNSPVPDFRSPYITTDDRYTSTGLDLTGASYSALSSTPLERPVIGIR